jgi:hypothetical protein
VDAEDLNKNTKEYKKKVFETVLDRNTNIVNLIALS